MSTLALLGGKPIRSTPFPTYNSIGSEEKRAVMEVMDTGVLSEFIASWNANFFGGKKVQALEAAWCDYFSVAHAVSLNSATSGLYAAVGAAGVGPGDEVIVSPYTMSASATAALIYGGIPVFADIDPHTFCLDPESIGRCISPRTRAIIVVDLFGHPADMAKIMSLARDHGLVVIEDAAQAPGAKYQGRLAGTLADMGVYSLNYHKTIHCGEGGVVVTDNSRFAERLQLIRNHAEVVVKAKGEPDLVNMVGFNYRMTEIEAAIAAEQLKKLEALVQARVAAADYLSERLQGRPGLTLPYVGPDTRHGYYLYVMKYDATATGISRRLLAEAIRAEGVPLMEAYVEPIYLQPMYQQRTAFGNKGYPFSLAATAPSYEKGCCPVTERMYERELLFTNICHGSIATPDVDDFTRAVDKVYQYRHELAGRG